MPRRARREVINNGVMFGCRSPGAMPGTASEGDVSGQAREKYFRESDKFSGVAVDQRQLPQKVFSSADFGKLVELSISNLIDIPGLRSEINFFFLLMLSSELRWKFSRNYFYNKRCSRRGKTSLPFIVSAAFIKLCGEKCIKAPRLSGSVTSCRISGSAYRQRLPRESSDPAEAFQRENSFPASRTGTVENRKIRISRSVHMRISLHVITENFSLLNKNRIQFHLKMIAWIPFLVK